MWSVLHFKVLNFAINRAQKSFCVVKNILVYIIYENIYVPLSRQMHILT